MPHFRPHKFVQVQTSLVDYLNAVTKVTAYAAAISLTKVPTVTNAPAWYADFMQDWSTVVSHGIDWVNAIAPDLMAIPSGYRDNNLVISDMLTRCAGLIDLLVANPNDADAKDALNKTLSEMNKIVGTPAQIDAEQQTIVAYRATLQTDAGKINKATQDALAQVGVDTAEVERLSKDIDSLRSEIEGYQNAIKTADIAAKAGIFIGVVGFVIAFGSAGLGAAIGTVGVIMVGGSYIAKIVLEKDIADANNAIANDTTQMTDLNAQVATFVKLRKDLDALIKLSVTAEAAFVEIMSFWTEFAADFRAFCASVASMEADVGAAGYAAAQKDITACLAGWQAFQNFLAPIADLTVTVDQQPTMINAKAA
jgi:hypothetical protein